MYRALVIAVLLVVAGCNAPASGPDTETATVTPVAVPETTATDRADELAPGVTDEGVVDPARLAVAHARTLNGVSYTVNQTLVRRYADGRLQSRYVTRARFAAEPGRFRVTVRQVDREDGRLVVRHIRRFGDGERAYIAETEANRTSYRLLEGTDGGPEDPTDVYLRNLTNRGPIERLFTLVPTETVGTYTRNGTDYVRVRSREPTTLPPLQNVTVAAVVSERGVVRSYRVRYAVTRDGELRATVAVSYAGVGTTTVERPAWVDRVNATATPSPTVDEA